MTHVSRRRLLAAVPAAGLAAAVPVSLATAGTAAAASGRPNAAPATPPRKAAALSLQEITDKWGTWMARERFPGSHGCRFTASTDYGQRGELGAYHKYQVSTEYRGITYDPKAPSPIPGQVSSVTTNYRNGSAVEQQVIYKQSKTTEQDLRISVTESLKIGVSMEVSAEIPAVAKVSETTSIETNLSSTQEYTHKETQNWGVDLPLKIPAKSAIEASLVIGTQKYDIDWTATVGMSGAVAIWFNDKVDLNHDGDYHWLWFVPIEEVFRDCRAHGIADTTGYEITAGGVDAFAGGKFAGGQGVAVNVNVVQKDLDGRTKRSAPRSLPVPLTQNGKRAVHAGR
ncbi:MULTISPECIES: ETX/MTX2 family pore-forming toxin [unclassified Streptomyces]|uniref:ETX/MTX2 family pore-forming toxin n=1 Tax=unclassified Streptomyces TaxID=2593676 RepID=UPI000371B53D|nr:MULTISPECIES: ETX/MTX2 family pore-forming toxin [unclassified Streptomyces]MYT29348.1 cytotoxin leucocidin [Streptomyces sp. SID8354]